MSTKENSQAGPGEREDEKNHRRKLIKHLRKGEDASLGKCVAHRAPQSTSKPDSEISPSDGNVKQGILPLSCGLRVPPQAARH